MVRAPLRTLSVVACVVAFALALASSANATVTRPHTVIPGACALDLRAGFSHCQLKLLGNLKRDPLAAAAPAGGYGPADIQSAYKLPAGGTGQTVAIVDAYDDKTAEADLNTYRSTYGLPACTTANGCFKKVNQNGVQGSYPANNQGWALEISLDIDMVSAACPSCHILLVEATNNSNADLYTAVDTAARLGANAISNSYGAAESSSDPASNVHFNHPGTAITASSGDGGYGVEYPGGVPIRDCGRRHHAQSRVQRSRVDGERLERRRQRLLRVRAQAVLADRLGLCPPNGGRRLGCRRSEHRRECLRLELQWARVAAGPVLQGLGSRRRNQRIGSDYRLGLRPGGQRRLGDLPLLSPLPHND